MYRPISEDVKEIGMNLLARGWNIQEVTETLMVSRASIFRWKANLEEHGTVINPSRSPQGRPHILSRVILDELHVILRNNPSAYLQELQLWLAMQHGVVISIPAIQRNLAYLGLAHKRLRVISPELNEWSRRTWMEAVQTRFRPEQLLFGDEMSKNTKDVARRYGYSMRGQDAEAVFPFCRGTRFSVLPVLSIDGYIALRIIEGSFDEAEFFIFIVEEVLPLMNPFPDDRSVLVLNNCPIHHIELLEEIFEAAGSIIIYLPPYSPDFNPIEESFHVVKTWLRHNYNDVEDAEDPVQILEEACGVVTREMSAGFYRNCGYNW